MSFIQIPITMTTAGVNLLAAADESGQKLKVSRVAFGNSTVVPNATTSGIGTILQETALYTQGVSLDKRTFTIQNLFDGIGVFGNTSGTIGVWIGNVLIGAAKHTMHSVTSGGRQIALKGVTLYTKPLVGADNITAVSLIGDLYNTGLDSIHKYVENGLSNSDLALIGLGHVNKHSELCYFTNIILDAAEMAQTKPATGTVSFYLQDMYQYRYNGTSWARDMSSGQKLSNIVIPGTFHRSDVTNSLYYVWSSDRFIRVSTQ